jgi:hypothetical protein
MPRRLATKKRILEHVETGIAPKGIIRIFENSSVRSLKVRRDKSRMWNGASIDTGAQRTVIGTTQAREYSKFTGIPFKLSPSKRTFAFGVDRRKSLGILQVRIPTPNNSFILLDADVVKTNIPLLVSLYALDKFGLTADTARNVLCCPQHNWETPLISKLGHIYLEWPGGDCILYTKAELQKLHRNFVHPSQEKLYALLKGQNQANLTKILSLVWLRLKRHARRVNATALKPQRFKTSLPTGEGLAFGSEISIDLMFIGGKAVLNVFDSATRFNAATFLDAHSESYGQSSDGSWDALIDI